MDYSNILKFKYTWRKYQARVLEHTKEYVADGKVHIVAAPGSGKTTLGIELIARMRECALVLAPSITIREQWKERIVDGFLLEGLNPDDYISQDLKNPRAITIATYQALHSAMNRYKGKIDESGNVEDDKEADDVRNASAKDTEEVDYSDFDIVKTMKANKIGLVCLDECHHLRSEWWKALEDLKKEMGGFKVIALTATPPYDSNATMWNRYLNMCGEIDEEIAIPELVKEGSLCPHQDFVYFNYPTKEEREEVEKFKTRSKAAYDKILGDAVFADAVASHRGLCGLVSDEELLDNPNYFAAILIYLQAKNIPFPDRLKRLLGTKRLPEMEASWLELLLQGFLYEDVENYTCDEEYRKELISYLKAEGVIEKKKVSFTTTPSIEKLLMTSKGKCESIKDIVAHEYKTDGKDLRLLVLTDYIRKEYEKALGADADVMSLGVIPFFEQLRRSVGTETDLRIGVLCGTIVIIPAEAKDALLAAVGDSGKITFSKIGNLSEEDYVKVNVVGDAHFLTGAVTDIFTQGCMQVLIGTKSLLGEGWDSPCINSLILASFVGSFMLSNQMRGRAIRVFKQNPEKTSNIWHLVCLSPWKEAGKEGGDEISEDYALLQRRMDHFLGLHYTEDIIENGIERLSVITPPFNEANVAKINQKMLELSGERVALKERWNRSLALHKKMDIVEETAVAEASVPKVVFKESLRGLIIAGVLLVVLLIVRAMCKGTFLGVIATIGLVADIIYALTKLPRFFQLMNAEKRLFAFGNGVRKALLKLGLMESAKSKVKVEGKGLEMQTVYLSGGTGRDKTLFTKCINELFGQIEDQRYLLVRSSKLRGAYDFYAVPECFAKRKEDATLFYECIKPYMGKYELVYTRSENGRQVLLEARMKTLTNQKNKTKSYKRVKDY